MCTTDVSRCQTFFSEDEGDVDHLCHMRVSLFFCQFHWLQFTFRKIDLANVNSTKGSFSASMGNSSLRSHLESVHKTEYLCLCAVKGWAIMLPKMRKDAKSVNLGTGSGGVPRPAFSQSQFLKCIVNFIVANDQVCQMPLKNCNLNHLYCSRSTSWSVTNFVISFFYFRMTWKRRTFPTA